MHELTLEQIERVEILVSNSEITYSHLPDDLIDHICCDVESEMSVGLSFKEAFGRVQMKFGEPGLQAIQEDTIMLIDQKYKFMKTTMKIFGNVSLAMLGIGTIFKLFHWPGASILLALGFLLLAFIFFPATIITSYRKNETKRPLLYTILIIGGIAFMLGVLFKIQHWSGASIMLTGGWIFMLLFFLPAWLILKLKEVKPSKERNIYTIGVIGVIIFGLSNLFKINHWPGAGIMTMLGAIVVVSVFLPAYATILYKKSNHVNGRFIYLMILTSLILLLVFLLNLNMSRSVYSSFPLSNKYNKIEKVYFENQNKAYYSELQNLSVEEQNKVNAVRRKADSICNSIYTIKTKLISMEKPISNEALNKYLNNINEIGDLYNGKPVSLYLTGENNNGYALDLKYQLTAYKRYIANLLSESKDIKQELDKLFPITDLNEFNEMKSWEDRTFKHSLLINALVQLSGIDRNVRIAEHMYLVNAFNKQKSEQIVMDKVNNIEL